MGNKRRLDSNALICDCQMLWLTKMLIEKQGTTQAAAICQYPDTLTGRSVSSLIEEFNCSKYFILFLLLLLLLLLYSIQYRSLCIQHALFYCDLIVIRKAGVD